MSFSLKKPFLSAEEVATVLGVEIQTIYAYVSRGLLHSESGGNKDRSKRYRREDVEQLLLRREERSQPGKTAKTALSLGQPVLESSITLLGEETLFYRGKNVLHLAETSNFEETAALLWEAEEVFPFRQEWPVISQEGIEILNRIVDRPILDRCRILIPFLEYEDPKAFRKDSKTFRKTASNILRYLTLFASGFHSSSGSISETLLSSWSETKKSKEPNDLTSRLRLLEAALILSADHELNVSSFTARCVASSEASLYQVVLAGLAALSGPKHGQLTEKAILLLSQANGNKKKDKQLLEEKLRSGENIPGFGHPLYKKGDPRGRKLIEMVSRFFPNDADVQLYLQFLKQMEELLEDYPTIDAGLALVSKALRLPKGAGIGIFAIGRTAGWLAHAMEQYDSGNLIRPRAKYIGNLPQE
ncbi:helix-turn-helix domain-containing protein [Leptospira langatensis]|uniref:citrate synthase (unknown stereospecificity) n=1 Tax=Leptospira langatensis TaxID=2484983 RepID=A0A5F1ZU86_9LEPT|nr:citrate synthase family protein [Leptospira langatensis]TGK03070.1 helix-turn-helix domain-containing protein [Leptospira langatensis]TGL41826.1 helix-turn-helix domain-containing protein [Leptospira langatensis]